MKTIQKLNKEQEKNLIVAENISKRLIAITKDCGLKYICQGKLKPYIYRRITAGGLLPDKERHTDWDIDENEIICCNGMPIIENNQSCIRVLFEDYDTWTGKGYFRLIPENIMVGNFYIVEDFFQKIIKYIDKLAGEKLK
jgi:hypothetical protein